MEKEIKLVEVHSGNFIDNELTDIMRENYEMYDYICERIIDNNIEYELEDLHNCKGLEVGRAVFGSIYRGDIELEITDFKEFYDNFSLIDNESTYDMMNEMKELLDNYDEDGEGDEHEELEEKINAMESEILERISTEIDERATMEGQWVEDVVYEHSDTFFNELDGWYVDINTNKLYSEFEAEKYLDEED